MSYYLGENERNDNSNRSTRKKVALAFVIVGIIVVVGLTVGLAVGFTTKTGLRFLL